MSQKEILPGYIRVERPEQAAPLPYSRTEEFTSGVGAGINELSFSYLGDILSLQSDPNIDANKLISEQDFYSHPLYREGMQYRPGMNIDLLQNYAEEYDRVTTYQQMQQQSGGRATALYTIGSFAAGFFDPINYTPIGIPLRGARFTYNVARAAGANAVLETALQPLAAKAYEKRGTELTAQQALMNIAFAAGAGGLIYSGLSGIKKGIGSMRDYGMITARPDLRGREGVIEGRNRDTFDIDDTFGDLVEQKAVQDLDNLDANIRNTNPFDQFGNKKFSYVDTTGTISRRADQVRKETFVKVYTQGNRKIVSGDMNSVLKVLPEIKKHVLDDDVLVVKFTNKAVAHNGRVFDPNADVPMTKQEIDKFVEAQAGLINEKIFGSAFSEDTLLGSTIAEYKRQRANPFEAKLDDSFNFRLDDGGDSYYAVQLDLNGTINGFNPARNVGRMFKVNKDGTRKLLTKDEANRVLKDKQEKLQAEANRPTEVPKRTSKVIDTEENKMINDTDPELKNKQTQANELRDNPDKAKEFNKKTVNINDESIMKDKQNNQPIKSINVGKLWTILTRVSQDTDYLQLRYNKNKNIVVDIDPANTGLNDTQIRIKRNIFNEVQNIQTRNERIMDAVKKTVGEGGCVEGSVK